MDLKEQAENRLAEARSAHAALTVEYEARLTALADDASVDDVQAITNEFTPQLDAAEELVKRTTNQSDEVGRLMESRKAYADLIPGGSGEVRITNEPATYDKSNPWGPSFFNDMYTYQTRNSRDALGRLERNNKETLDGLEQRGITLRDLEGRALSSTSTAGGDFLPPLYFGDLYAEFKRAKRVTANLVRNLPLAAQGNTITIPRITAGGSAAAQTADNQNVANVDPTTDLVTASVCTVAGYVDLSRQIVERSEPGLDQLVLEDLLRSYNKNVNSYVVNGSGSSGQPYGILNQSGINTITYTDGSPTVPEIYPKLFDAVRQVTEAVFEESTCFIMTARRWAWFASFVDSTGRPVVLMNNNGPFNAQGIANPANSSFVDNMVPAGWLAGMPVFIDETLPKTNGTGTNQDVIITGALKEDILWEDPAGPRSFQFEGVTSQTAAIRTMVFGYMAFTAGRYPKANSVISGTGMTAPSF